MLSKKSNSMLGRPYLGQPVCYLFIASLTSENGRESNFMQSNTSLIVCKIEGFLVFFMLLAGSAGPVAKTSQDVQSTDAAA